MSLTSYTHNGITLKIRTDVRNAAEKDIIREVQREYPWNFPITTAIDIGAHVGAWTKYAKHLHPDAKIIAVEVDPETFSILEENTAGLPDVMLVHARAGYVDEPHLIWRHVVNSGSTMTWRSEEAQYIANDPEHTWLDAPPNIGIGQLINLIDFDVVDVLKMDCEGAEIEILNHMLDETLARIQRIVGEIHDEPSVFEEKINNRLETAGFEVRYRSHPGDDALFYIHAWRP